METKSSATAPDLMPLMVGASQKDAESFGRLYDILAPTVLGLSLRILGNLAAAEETVVDVFSGIWGQTLKFESGVASPLVWITTLTRTRALERLRAGGNVVPMAIAFEAPDSAGTSTSAGNSTEESWIADESRRARAALEGLSSDIRRIIEMAYFEGLSSEEISRRLLLTPETVRARIRTGMNRFREGLGPHHPEGGVSGQN
ncbi:MAG: sigma-70 family RNA polymerase sigma factor [Acidobacteriota bacterium]